MTKQSDQIDLLKRGDEKAICKFYNTHKNTFILFANRYNLNQADLVDIYQEAIIAFIHNIKKGKLDNLQSSLSTYFFSIGKFMIFQKLKKEKIIFPTNDFSTLEYVDEDYNEDQISLQVALLQEGLQRLGEQCRKVLQLYYYEEKKLEEICELLGYNNKDVVKSQKSRCLKQLKDSIKDKINE